MSAMIAPCLLARLLAAMLAATGLPAAAAKAGVPAPDTSLEIGRTHILQSRSLGEARTLHVVLPASYATQPNTRYPVLYLLDGGLRQDLLHVAGVVHLGALWGRSSEAIIVGVESKDRRKELVGTTRDADLRKRYPTAGQSARFRAFIRAEVKPLIERTYRISGQDLLLGESLAGLFTLETLLTEPAMFDGYGAVDPSLWWDKEALSKTAAAGLGDRHSNLRLFMAMAKEQAQEPAAMTRMAAALRGSGLALCFADRPDLSHSTIYQQILPQALQFLLPPAEAPPAEYGFALDCADQPASAKSG